MFSIASVGNPSESICLVQPWLSAPEPRFQSAVAHLCWSPSSLHILVTLTDDHVFSNSTDHNQSLHLLGDTLEVFLRLPNASHYHELHVSPNNHRTCLRWPLGAIENVRNGTASLESFRIDPNAFTSRMTTLKNGWQVEMEVPACLLDLTTFASGQEMLLSISRYDYNDLETPPTLSTTASHSVKNFHQTSDWLSIKLI